MRLDTALLKHSAFWAMILIAWMALATVAYHYSKAASVVVGMGWLVFLYFLFGRILPNARK
jgi:hypothetical protein